MSVVHRYEYSRKHCRNCSQCCSVHANSLLTWKFATNLRCCVKQKMELFAEIVIVLLRARDSARDQECLVLHGRKLKLLRQSMILLRG
jgi:hypothetical protein